MPRHKEANWDLPEITDSWDQAHAAILMDIRDELKLLRAALAPLRHLECSRFLALPGTLDRIARNTAKPRRRKRTS